jgi:hypothetical protein
LKTLGFETIVRENLTIKQIGGVYREFRSKIVPGGVALVFYAGHGLQFKGHNYFPAVDSDINSEEEVPLQSINLSTLLDMMEEAKAGVSLVFLDACRDNPFARRFRSSSRGLAKVEAASGTLIHYATKPGSVASDGDGSNGTYTEALLAQISQAGVPVEQMLKQVTNRVIEKTKGKQEPWVEGSLRGDFYFLGPTTIQIPLVSPSEDDPDTQTWRAAQQINSVGAYQAYLLAFPKGKFGVAAQLKLESIKHAQSPQIDPSVTSLANVAPATGEQGTHSGQFKAQRLGIAVGIVSGSTVDDQTVSRVLSANLDRSGRFQVVNSHGKVLSDNERPTQHEWSNIGAEYLVAGTVKLLPQDLYDVRVRFWNLVDRKDMGGQSFRVSSRDLRHVAHRLTDALMNQILNIASSYSRRIAHVTFVSDVYQLWISDSDGANSQPALNSKHPILLPTFSGDDSSIAYVSYESGPAVVLVHKISSGTRIRAPNSQTIVDFCSREVPGLLQSPTEVSAEFQRNGWRLEATSKCMSAMTESVTSM